jgi:hypothetical protein
VEMEKVKKECSRVTIIEHRTYQCPACSKLEKNMLCTLPLVYIEPLASCCYPFVTVR